MGDYCGTSAPCPDGLWVGERGLCQGKQHMMHTNSWACLSDEIRTDQHFREDTLTSQSVCVLIFFGLWLLRAAAQQFTTQKLSECISKYPTHANTPQPIVTAAAPAAWATRDIWPTGGNVSAATIATTQSWGWRLRFPTLRSIHSIVFIISLGRRRTRLGGKYRVLVVTWLIKMISFASSDYHGKYF